MPSLVSSSEDAADATPEESEESPNDSVYTVLPYAQDLIRVECASCGRTAGIYKLCPNPGGRDNPMWVMRCVDPATNAIPTRAPYTTAVVCLHMRKGAVQPWIQAFSNSCRR